ncbi:MAG: DNA polymerase I [Bacteroidales bacterium]|nr:DNA polymerase I [Bacteroidales bacterium]
MHMKRRLFLLDAYALIYRAYYGFISKPLVNSKGVNTGAIYGFVKTLQDVLGGQKMPGMEETLAPDLIAVCFDPKGGTFRHKEFPTYKAQREAQPEDITIAVPWIKKIIEAYRIPIFEVANYEADDVVGTLARLADETGEYDTFLMSPDKDYAQLVSEHSRIFKPKSFGPGYEILDVPAVLAKYGLQNTSQVIDMLGLQGDSADNIPGCPGVGPKTAQKLIEDFGSIEEMLRQVEEAAAQGRKELPQMKKTMFAKVLDNAQQIRDSKYLATICRTVPGVTIDPEQLQLKEPDNEALYQIFDELEFRQLRDKLKPSATPAPSGDLFASVLSEQEEAEKPVVPMSHLADVPHQYTICNTAAQRAALVQQLGSVPAFAFDTETTSTDVMEAELVGISFAIDDHRAWYIPVPADPKAAQSIVEEVRPLLENGKVLKVAQNLKYDYSVLRRYGLEVAEPCFDTMIAHYLLEPEQPHNMDHLSEVYLHYTPIPTSALLEGDGQPKAPMYVEDLFAQVPEEPAPAAGPTTMRDCPVEQVAEYCCEDSDVTFQLYRKFAPMLESEGMEKLFSDIEMPLVCVLADMELTGVRLDASALKESESELKEELQRLDNRLAELVGHPFNPLSPKAVATVLYDEQKMDPKGKSRSTAEEILQQLRNKVLDNEKKVEIIDDILAYRGVKKLLSTYIEALPLEVNPRTGRIHAQFNQTITATGRLSSSHPNLQNIPVRDEMGRVLRKAFVPDPGEVFFSADYSQIELRLMAHLSQDPNMVEAFLSGEDIHRATAAKIYHLPLDEVSKLQRNKAKTANFGIIYGISSFGLASRLNISRTEAKELIDGYFATYPKVKEYMDKCIAVAHEKGYVETLFGRKRMLPDIHSANATVRGYAERNAINAPIQGTAADIIKIAMVHIARRIKQEGLHAKLLIQVHDELNFSVPAAELEQLQRLVLEEMAGACALSVPLIADCGSGDNWLAAH